MNSIPLEVKVKSAHVFKNANHFSKLRLYAVGSIFSGGGHSSYTTTVDRHSRAQPFWWFPMRFNIDEWKLRNDLTVLVLCIKSRRALLADKKIGQVRVPISDLFGYYYNDGNRISDVAFTVVSDSGKARGVIYLSYMFGREWMNNVKPPCLCNRVPSAPPLYSSAVISSSSIAEEESFNSSSNCIPSAPYLPQEFM